ncbi:MAG: Xanthine and dehydrogenase maturation factor, XdhC/CoxF family [Myxococcaceae bacterium]|nr:Xanthine and dehydrogenase maturation factor, XdhC/CoxF family [Myxococcaceae bacterium]
MREELMRALLAALERGLPAALATVVRTSGSTPQRAGARLLLQADGSTLGTVGGGAIEHDVLAALEACRSGAPAQLLVRELGYDLAMCCGGRMEVFVEPVVGAPRLWLCGAGHVAKALAPLAASIGFAVVVVDEREELNSEARFLGAERILLDPATQLKRSTLTQRDWVLIATHDHALDEQVLELALLREPHYIGLVGSKRKVFRLLQRIVQRQGPISIERLYAPVGLPLEGLEPAEIAVSIAAELVALRRGADVSHLRAMNDPRLLKLLGELGGERIAAQDSKQTTRVEGV